jgi:hypothetical protein
MARVGAKALYIGIGGVVRVYIAINEAALTGCVEEPRKDVVALAVSGVEMGDGDTVGGVVDLGTGAVEPGMMRILEPAPIEG